MNTSFREIESMWKKIFSVKSIHYIEIWFFFSWNWKNYLLKVRNRRLWWRLGWRMRRWMHATSAADGWRNSALVLKNKTKLLLSLLCEINSQLFVYNFKTIKIIIYVSLERSDPYDLCYYCSCQMRLLENLYWKNIILQKKFFSPWNWKIAIIQANCFCEMEKTNSKWSWKKIPVVI